ncbi:MAG TPA: ABC transporter permease [Mucilaginibacter sp.]|nr:ABC transporter permease [Mucilaginibacter sp.]
MIKNYLKIAWRSFLKDRQFAVLNLLGLATGIACTLLIYLWVHDEMNVDKFFANNDQIYQVMEHAQADNDATVTDESTGLISDILPLRRPEIKYAASVAPADWFQKFTLSSGDKNIKASGQYAGKDYFNIFSFKLFDGKKDKVLADKNSIVISDELANKLFGTTQNLTGKVVHFQHQQDFFISGVFEKTSPNSSQQFDFVLPFEYLYSVQGWVKSWNNTGPHNYVLLREGTDVKAFNQKIANVITEFNKTSTRSPFAAKFSDNYLLNTFSHGSKTGSKVVYVRLFSLIAIFILIIACINFMNLSTAKASGRMKEIGIKKVLGAERSQLIVQFLSESMLMTALSTLLALGFTWLLLPQFNQITGKQLTLDLSPQLVLALIGISLFTGLLSGSYPALYLSKFNPLAVLKSKVNTSFGALISRKGLVVFQFTLSVILIVSVLVVYRQIKYIQSADPGYNKDNIVRFDSDGKLQGKQDVFVERLKTIPGVVNASFTFNNMIGRNFGTTGLDWDGKNPNENIYFEGFGGGYGFAETMGMHMAQGRSFNRKYGADDSALMVNEAAVAVMHLKNPVGKNIRKFGHNARIIGVVKNFHFESLHEPVKPAYFMPMRQEANPWIKFVVRIKGGQQKETIEQIKQLYEASNPGFPFSYDFLDEAYQKQYETEVRVGVLSKYFSGLAILISCLGLFGLAAFTAQKRQKEIGIRKVVGASVQAITLMLSKDFLKLVLIALLLAFPISWYLMSNWLQGFAYRIDLNAGIFLLAGLAIMLITLLTISYQSIKAALANPVKSLRSE